MNRINSQQRQEIANTNTDRLRGRLLKAGLDEESVFALVRNALMEAYAEFLLKPPYALVEPQGDEGREIERTRAEDRDIKLQELELRKMEIEEQTLQREQKKLRREEEKAIIERELKIRELEIERQQQKDRLDQKRKE